LATASKFPDGLNATEYGRLPVLAELAAVKEPPVPTVKVETVLLPPLATASRFPDGLNATDCGWLPVVVGEPAAVREPPAPTVNMETVLLP
jgi:hypothetical protein